ncbi:NEDD8-specific protease 1-like [Fagus crenata]|uniref:Ubiquitin-like protease family profile domain-containing protein n=1 Tax=Fagus sylvatica TaxID=28930 RepID=A0A2N9IZ33_FAGSY
MSDKEVLTYEDIVLRASDLDILEGPCYLNDQIIAFYFGYLSSSCNNNDILLVPPSVSFWLANCRDEDLKDLIEPLKLSSKKLIIFTVNDNDDLSGGDSGTHWSLIVYDRSKNTFSHHDSMEGVNNAHALKLYEAVKGFMGKAAEPTTLPSSSSSQGRTRKRKDMSATAKAVAVAKSGAAADAAPSFIECNTPQQTNGYDCGLYVIAIAKVICQWHSSKSKDKESNWISAIERHVDASLEMTMRKEVLKLIEDLRKED